MASRADQRERLATLDGLRGVAVMGILLINVSAFALPDAVYFSPVAYGDSGVADIIAWAANLVLVDGKMRYLFSLLFGASLLLVVERAEAAGESGARVHYTRMAVLLGFGLAHFYFLWSGDILAQYAAIGILAFAFRRLGARSLFRLGIAFLLIQFLVAAGFAGWLWYLREAVHAPGADPALVDAWRAFGGPARVSEPAMAREIARYQQDYAAIVIYRLDRLRLGPIVLILFTGCETLGMMLLGMAGLKSGFLAGRWERARYRRLALLCYALGIPYMLVLVALCAASGFDPLLCFAAVTALSAPARPVIMFGHASLIILWLVKTRSPLAARVTAAGRAAFSNYILTSLIMTSLFYGYGFALFGQVGRVELHLAVLATWAVMLLWSKPWLARYRYGPLEWLWRSLARGRMQPMRRQGGE